MAPTPVQTMAIPVLQAGRDLFAQAQTGTGKTAAFAIPILEKVNAALKRPQALIVVPTRELAVQVTREFGAIGKYRKSHEVAIYGGVPYGPQERALARGTQIVVGTPGRLLDHIEKGNLDLSGVFVVVLDEADRLLDMGFAPEVRRLLRRAPERRQTALFSATLVADRGLHIEDISHVVNYDLPEDADVFTHRVGRTGRAGKTGVAVTFVGEWDFDEFDQLRAKAGVPFRREILELYDR